MKRDMDLVRRILFAAEEIPAGSRPTYLDILDVTEDELGAHVALLIDAGLIEGSAIRAFAGNYGGATVTRLTWSGHDYLDQVRSETVWSETKSTILSRGLDLSIEAIKVVATEIIKHRLGLGSG
jgi:hypothetical protein